MNKPRAAGAICGDTYVMRAVHALESATKLNQRSCVPRHRDFGSLPPKHSNARREKHDSNTPPGAEGSNGRAVSYRSYSVGLGNLARGWTRLAAAETLEYRPEDYLLGESGSEGGTTEDRPTTLFPAPVEALAA